MPRGHTATGEPPVGWVKRGADPSYFRLTRDTTVAYRGRASARLTSARPGQSPARWASAIQGFRADDYRGRRLRLTVWLRTERADTAQAFMRVDGRLDGRPVTLRFDNMADRLVTATVGWTQHAIVLDVPPEAEMIVFGTILSGRGTVWYDELAFEAVDAAVPTTGRPRELEYFRDDLVAEAEAAFARVPRGPVNLDFEQQ